MQSGVLHTLTVRRLVFSFVLLLSIAARATNRELVIVISTGDRQDLKQRVVSLGGKIRREFQNVNAVSATMPTEAVSALGSQPQFKVRKAGTVFSPSPRGPRGLRGVVEVPFQGHIKFTPETIAKNAQARPTDYVFNNSLINAGSLQAGGNLGQGVVIAEIDSGTANNPDVVPSLDGVVIGGESFVPADEDPVTSATSTRNGPHGTWVGTMIAGNAGFLLPNSSCLARSIQLNSPNSVLDGNALGFPGFQVLPLVGVAPGAKIYALKVFSSQGGGSPEDRIIAAMDRVITIKKNFLAGKPSVPVSGSGTEDDPYVYDSLNIQVLNMSLGGPTLAASRDAEGLLTQELLQVGITVAASAGNAGPALLTTGSPSTGLGSVSAAAANVPAHERIFWDVAGIPGTCAVGFGLIARPSNTIQTAYFSSRGPTADGRVGTDVTSAGFFNFAQGADGGLSFVSGTSFTAPTVAGAAALLRVGAPKATATEVRNALIFGANPHIVSDRSGVVEQGAGFLDVAKSLSLLQRHKVLNFLPPFPFFTGDVAANALRFGVVPRLLDPNHPATLTANNVVPGETREFLVRVDRSRSEVQVAVNSVTPKLPAEQQNQVFGDDIYLAVHQAKTSSHGEGDYPFEDFVNAPTAFTIDDPEPGYMRVVIMGDWTNAGPVSASVTLTATNVGTPVLTKVNKINDGDFQFIPFAVPSGAASVRFELTWQNDWSHYPTNDLDLIILDPDGKEIDDGATLNGREVAEIKSPKPGNWTAVVAGFDIFGKLKNDGTQTGPRTDTYQLRVYQQ